MDFHPLCNLLPEMRAEEFAELVDDIRAHGQRVPIVTHEGAILDGKHRYRACKQLSLKPQFQPFIGTDPAAFVVSINLRRRELTVSQKAMAAARLKDWHAEEARKRMSESGRMGGLRKGVDCSPPPSGSLMDCSPEAMHGKARDMAGAAFGVSGRSVDRAAAVLASGNPALIKDLEEGRVSLGAAEKIARTPVALVQPLAAQPSKRKRRGLPGDHFVPGTQLIKALMLQLEIFRDALESDDAGDVAGRFFAEFDESEPLLVNRLHYIRPALEFAAAVRDRYFKRGHLRAVKSS